MIWHEEIISSKEQPEDITLKLVGIYNPPSSDDHTIIIQLHINNNIKVIFSKDPSTLSHEEPLPEEVFAKYKSKIIKFRKSIQNSPYESILNW